MYIHRTPITTPSTAYSFRDGLRMGRRHLKAHQIIFIAVSLVFYRLDVVPEAKFIFDLLPISVTYEKPGRWYDQDSGYYWGNLYLGGNAPIGVGFKHRLFGGRTSLWARNVGPICRFCCLYNLRSSVVLTVCYTTACCSLVTLAISSVSCSPK